jgi:hypothetical protein
MLNLNSADLFEKNRYIHVKDVMSKEMCYFLTQLLLRKCTYPGEKDDDQVRGCLATLDHELIFETLLEKLWPDIEMVTGKNLLPTYAYARLYTNNNVLEKHKDRDECEISVTIQLGRSHHYSWPIWMDGQRYDLGEGDAVIYRGCELDHWRKSCDGPTGYYSGQVFLHFVDADGPFAHKAYDSSTRKTWNNMFKKHRSIFMDSK